MRQKKKYTSSFYENYKKRKCKALLMYHIIAIKSSSNVIAVLKRILSCIKVKKYCNYGETRTKIRQKIRNGMVI